MPIFGRSKSDKKKDVEKISKKYELKEVLGS